MLLASPIDQIEVAEARVVVVVVDVDRAPAALAEGQGQPLARAAVERVERRGFGRRAHHDPLGRQELVGQRQLHAGVDVERRLDAELREQVEHAGGGSHGVAVGAFVHGDRHLRLAAHGGAHGRKLWGDDRHGSRGSSAAASVVSSPAAKSSEVPSVSSSSGPSSPS